ncbi:PHP domain-containing protein [Mycobacterium sp. 236(2023)]|uniref:PHP domain-containing protein n=1 Tax=Mycobacterium sp. 236(2023) TaxID=3038163 RepID=UPI0024154843|nr:PHP domain-containing protein [Mycobacterium sp. 236(2023)]MDG4666656.1 PHP domain-containing protein [Mycobacterium sp. 236(2023)]
MLPSDNHVHTRWSWDTAEASTTERQCRAAIERGVPAVAFTEHVDFTAWSGGDRTASLEVGDRPGVLPLDIAGYTAEIARCRDMFPELRILSGIEAGEPHYFAASVANVLGAGNFDRVLGSLHAIPLHGRLEWVDAALFARIDAHDLMDRYFTDMVTLVEDCDVFTVLAHCDYPRRYWPADRAGPYREADFEEHYRTVFRGLAPSGRALEINTRSPLASVELIRWWWEEGGDAVSYGSDAHVPERLGDQFELAVDIVEAAGFRPGRDRFDFWRR